MNCPVCNSAKVREHKVQKGGVSSAVLGFQVIGDRECQACGAVWNPGCSRIGAVGCIVGGVILLAACLVPVCFFVANANELTIDSHCITMAIVLGFLAFAGLYSLGYGIAVLDGRAGALKILASPRTDEQASDLPADGNGSDEAR